MTDAEKAALAAEAQRLKENEAFAAALAAMRANALEELAACEPTDADEIRYCQAEVRVIDNLRAEIEAMIRRGQPRRPSGIV